MATINELLTNYGYSSGLGIHMQVSMELLIIERGVSSFQVLPESFSQYGKWVMHSWLRSLWEKVDMFEFHAEVRQTPLEPPREGNSWLMVDIVNLGVFNADELIWLNCFRCHHHVIFKSDVFDASGRALDKQYLRCRPRVWSTLLFLQESPPPRDLTLWQQALYLLAPRGQPEH